MSQFAFAERQWPDVFDAAARAESAARADSRASCFYARRALELAVVWMYKHDAAVTLPYQENLSGFATPHGYATTGVITPGRYEFTADHEEHVLILLSGILRVKLPGRDCVDVPANDAYVVPAGTLFEVESATDVSYLCRYYPRRNPE